MILFCLGSILIFSTGHAREGVSDRKFTNVNQVVMLLEGEVGNVVLSYEINITPQGDAQANIQAAVNGMLQMPTGVNAATFAADAKALLASGYVTDAKRAFEGVVGGFGTAFTSVFGVSPVPEIRNQIVVPPRTTQRSKPYNRNFTQQRRSYPPRVYGYMDTRCPYYYDAFMDPWDYYWYCMIMDDLFCDGVPADYGYVDPTGEAMDAAVMEETYADMQVESGAMAEELTGYEEAFAADPTLTPEDYAETLETGDAEAAEAAAEIDTFSDPAAVEESVASGGATDASFDTDCAPSDCVSDCAPSDCVSDCACDCPCDCDCACDCCD